MADSYVATLGSIDFAFTLSAQGPRTWKLTVVDAEKIVDAAAVRPGTWSLLIDGRAYLVELDEGAKKIRVRVGEEEAELVLASETHHRLSQIVAEGASGGSSGEEIEAPIAGRVVKVCVELGAKVAAGDVVVVLEAMKMENEIRCDSSGVVESINVVAGDSVEGGEIILSIAAVGDDG